MPKQVVNLAMISCAQGASSTPLTVLPTSQPMVGMQPAASIMDNVPMVNIMPFGTCKVLTAAASGVPTPCVPATAAPWAPGSPTVMVGNKPALHDGCKLVCSVGGVISVTNPGQQAVDIP